MQWLLTYLGLTESAADQGGETIRRIEAALSRIPPDRARYMASFAFILSRIAHVDQHVSPDEIATMKRLVEEKGGLTPDEAALVVDMAEGDQLLFGGTDGFLITRDLARDAAYDQKVHLIECLFAVAAADGRIKNAEAEEIGRVAREIKVDQIDLSRIRSSYREFLAVRM